MLAWECWSVSSSIYPCTKLGQLRIFHTASPVTCSPGLTGPRVTGGVNAVLILSAESLDRTRNHSHSFCLGFYRAAFPALCSQGRGCCVGQGCAGHPWQVECCDLCRGPTPVAWALVSGHVWDTSGFPGSLKQPRSPVGPGSDCQPGMNLLCRSLFRQLSGGLSEIQAQQRRKLLLWPRDQFQYLDLKVW